jgi:hypothetical protein
MTVRKRAYLEEPFSAFREIGVDCVLWNPWIDKAASLPDMDDDGYLRFLCVEPGVVADYVLVPPGVALCLEQHLLPALPPHGP